VARQELYRGWSRACPHGAVHGCPGTSRHNAALKTFRDRPIAAGKPTLVTLIATARKLITILNAILRDGMPWQTA
jgi:transposase